MVTHTATPVDGGKVRLDGSCPWCKKAWTLTVTVAEYRKWLDGHHIQDAMPSVPSGERELLISGVCEPCFDNAFKEE